MDFDVNTLRLAIDDLANGRWSEGRGRPRVALLDQQTLWPVPARQQFRVFYPDSRIRWDRNPMLEIDWVTDEPFEVPLLPNVGATWVAPCHALFNAGDVLVASISGILSFDGWEDQNEFDEFFNCEDLDVYQPMIAALDSSLGFERNRDQAALVSAAKIVLGIQSHPSAALVEALDQHWEL